MHRLLHKPPVFDDPYAVALTSPAWSIINRSRALSWLVGRMVHGTLETVVAQVVGRSRFAEDMLQRAIERGVNQYVIVGAGFDSYALRHNNTDSELAVFEIDHPDTQRVKRERLQRSALELPAKLHFIAIDFEVQAFASAFDNEAFNSQQPAFFSWLGTTPYLTHAATESTLAAIGQHAAVGSEIVFDYLAPDELLSESDRQVMADLRRFTERRGEPLIGYYQPDAIGPVLADLGLEVIDNLSAADQVERYFFDRDDGLSPMPSSYLVRARVAAREP